eukprot:m.295765 g.295765  ORF g.295765 m.295765 type:complete len:64 (-) comp20047_c0_seq7:144-335(-)
MPVDVTPTCAVLLMGLCSLAHARVTEFVHSPATTHDGRLQNRTSSAAQVRIKPVIGLSDLSLR